MNKIGLELDFNIVIPIMMMIANTWSIYSVPGLLYALSVLIFHNR